MVTQVFGREVISCFFVDIEVLGSYVPEISMEGRSLEIEREAAIAVSRWTRIRQAVQLK